MARRRRRRRNPGGVVGWATKHPWLTVLFVLPTVVYGTAAIVRAIGLAGTPVTQFGASQPRQLSAG